MQRPAARPGRQVFPGRVGGNVRTSALPSRFRVWRASARRTGST